MDITEKSKIAHKKPPIPNLLLNASYKKVV